MTTKVTAPQAALQEKIVEQVAEFRGKIQETISQKVIGQKHIIDLTLTSLFSGGHCLLTGVPGLAKTLIIRSLGELLDLKFSRIQFTPDLMPSDILGTEILEEDRATGKREFRFMQGPIFANLILADEVNRTPPKTQAALLEAMQEHRITTCGRTFKLDAPFFVLATQNPIEAQGTYPLPEAQLDRFMFNLKIDYLPEQEEVQVVQRTTSAPEAELEPIITKERILEYQSLVLKVPVSDKAALYAVRLAAATRPVKENPLDYIKKWVTWGAGIRGGQQIILAAKAWALLHGRYHVSYEDIEALAIPALRHRVITNYFAESEGVDADEIIARVMKNIQPPASGIH